MKLTAKEAASDVSHGRQMAFTDRSPPANGSAAPSCVEHHRPQSYSCFGIVNRAFESAENCGFVDVDCIADTSQDLHPPLRIDGSDHSRGTRLSVFESSHWNSESEGNSNGRSSLPNASSSECAALRICDGDASSLHTNPSVDSACQLKRSGALRIKPRSPRKGHRPRRLWFERNWDSVPISTHDDAEDNPSEERIPDAYLGHHGHPRGSTATSAGEDVLFSSVPRKGSYSIGIFYSDTEQCQRHDSPDASSVLVQSGKRTGDVGVTSAMSHLGEEMGPPHETHRDRRSCRSSRQDGRRSANTNTTTANTTQDTYASPTESGEPNNNALPDILNSHLPPPYSTLPPSGGRRLPPPSHPPPPPPPLCGTATPSGGTVLPPCPHSTGPRRTSRGRGGPFRGFPPRDRGGRRGPSFSAPAASESDEPKHCCGVMVTQTVSIRWFIVMIAFVGLCCAIVGTVLGALKATGREHLTVSLLMIGVGIVLITVSGIAWRLTSHDAPSCRAMLGLQASEQEPNRRFVPRVPPYGRPHHPYAAMMYPEFQYRPPPPSYQASMQEYRLRLLLLDRQQTSGTPNTTTALSPVSPPPTYRSHTATTLQSRYLDRPPLTLTEREYSRPPSYRSRASSAGLLRPAGDAPHTPASHSRQPSLSLSFLSHESLFLDSAHSRAQQDPVHFTSPSGESQNSVVAGLSDDSSPPGGGHTWRLPPQPTTCWTRKHHHHHDVNAVTIVQTTDSSQVLNRDTVILSVPGQDRPVTTTAPISPQDTVAGEVRILAHV